jgi:hypothetical protein
MTWTSPAGREFAEDVPDIWLAGFCQHNKCTVEQALAHWRSQSEMGAE